MDVTVVRTVFRLRYLAVSSKDKVISDSIELWLITKRRRKRL